MPKSGIQPTLSIKKPPLGVQIVKVSKKHCRHFSTTYFIMQDFSASKIYIVLQIRNLSSLYMDCYILKKSSLKI